MIEMGPAQRLLSRLAAGALALGLCIAPQLAAAGHTGASAIRECRMTVGKPIVQSCVRSKVLQHGGHPRSHVQACRTHATPSVRSCVQQTVPHLVEHCRETVGRPAVRACIQERMRTVGGRPYDFIDQCRLSVAPAMRACVRRAAAGPQLIGRAPIEAKLSVPLS
jgi:hypothetical protein